ncbi:MAG: WYL domain-containing protein, partial [Erysipelotrichaceae bacterium]|nr:WYL domain-containing protein [Erysipelotrichaceae bacterium]
IQFTYFDLGLYKKRHYRRNKNIYQGDPYALLWENKAYYLLFKMDSHDEISQYRVDKMDNVHITEIIYESKPFDLKQYRTQRINMYSGEKVNVTLEFKHNDRLVSLLYDQFGDDFMILSQTEDKFTVNLDTSISPTLMGWLATLNTQVKIIKPQSLINEYQDYLKRILTQYGEDHETDQ